MLQAITRRASPHALAILGGTGLLVVGAAIGYASAAQPHMANALAALRNAAHELQAAEADKGGHRVAAMRLVDQAITEVREGMAAGR